MVFSSLIFLCIFLPIVFSLHSIIPSIRIRNILLVIASLLFYAFGEPVYVFLMLFSTVLNYVCALLMEKANKRLILSCAVIINIGLLGVFKYAVFFVSSINSIFHLQIAVPEIILPIGISFFTFQALSYVIDVYRGEVEIQKDYFKVLLYISFFPQLIAGPIVKYKDIAKEIEQRKVTIDNAACGLRRFCFGLSKKVLIANSMASVADQIFAKEIGSINFLLAWMGAVAYTMQIYFDFSGYSDMAIGLGRMFGFRFRENFDYPYGSVTIKEFWRRWHISLSSWFKEYVYIPLGGNRKGRIRTGLNKMIVFFLTGLWHGANWTFVAWGLFHGCFSFLEELLPGIKKLPRVILHIYTMLVVTVGFVIFRADSIGQAGAYVVKMFTDFHFSAVTMSYTYQLLNPYFVVMLLVAVIACAPARSLMQRIRLMIEKENIESGNNMIIQIASYCIAFLLLTWCLIRLSAGSYNPFIYFRF